MSDEIPEEDLVLPKATRGFTKPGGRAVEPSSGAKHPVESPDDGAAEGTGDDKTTDDVRPNPALNFSSGLDDDDEAIITPGSSPVSKAVSRDDAQSDDVFPGSTESEGGPCEGEDTVDASLEADPSGEGELYPDDVGIGASDMRDERGPATAKGSAGKAMVVHDSLANAPTSVVRRLTVTSSAIPGATICETGDTITIVIGFASSRLARVSSGRVVDLWESNLGWTNLVGDSCSLETEGGERVVIDTEDKLRRAVSGDLRLYGQLMDTSGMREHFEQRFGSFVSDMLDRCIGDVSWLDGIHLYHEEFLMGVMKTCRDLYPHMVVEKIGKNER